MESTARVEDPVDEKAELPIIDDSSNDSSLEEAKVRALSVWILAILTIIFGVAIWQWWGGFKHSNESQNYAKIPEDEGSLYQTSQKGFHAPTEVTEKDGIEREEKPRALKRNFLGIEPATKMADSLLEWIVFLKASPEALGQIRCVEYTLPPTFPIPVVTVCDIGRVSEPFPLHASGRGTFDIKLRVFLKDGQVIYLSHALKFD
jgi:hypothetical protein